VNVIEELAARTSATKTDLIRELIERAQAVTPASPSDRAAFVRPTSWLLDAVGSAGIPLTASGTLPSDVAERMLIEFSGLESGVPSAKSIADQLRAIALVTVRDGILVRTRTGDSLAGRPDETWAHLARTIAITRHAISSDGVKLLLLLLAADAFDKNYQQFIADGLDALGWRSTGTEPLSQFDAFESVLVQYRFLVSSGAIGTDALADRLVTFATPIGIAFAREALAVESS